MTVPLVILGAGGNCIDILDAITARDAAANPYRVVGFLDDDPERHGEMLCGYPVLGAIRSAAQCTSGFPNAVFVNGVGSPKSFLQKPACIASTEIARNRFVSIVHPAATVSPHATIGQGTVILAHATIGARAVVGDHVMILPGCVVGHDCRIDAYAIVAAGTTLCADVHLQTSCYVGAGSVILGGITVSTGALVGAGSVVTRDVLSDTVVCGNPARRLRHG
ncbi:MAG: NeuD/PglB/VioB family sugar acetyltransferase [Deltaproteobacteria bacterium]|nr:NeuD/PglB/VioB family sugar acetyltransferase [Deltaproteobacteria bacterium]